MNRSIETLMKALAHGMEIRPKVGGFPYLAEALRAAGVSRNIWTLPSCQSIFLTKEGPVVMQDTPLISGAAVVPPFDCNALIQAIRIDQAGESTFPQFLEASWKAGVVGYEVDFSKRSVTYRGCFGEEYVEDYPHVELP